LEPELWAAGLQVFFAIAIMALLGRLNNMKKLYETGRFTLQKDEDTGKLEWVGGSEGDMDESRLKRLVLEAKNWPVGTVIIAMEPIPKD
jgi:hypothetical protein